MTSPESVRPVNVDLSDYMFISNNEVSSISLVSQPLVDETNYITWRKSMEISLGCKNKMEFINGQCPRPTDTTQLSKWMRCNNFVFSWILASVSKEIAASLIHSKDAVEAWSDLADRYSTTDTPTIYAIQEEIYAFKQGELSIPKYQERLVQLWGQEEGLNQHELCALGSQCRSTKWMIEKRTMDKAMKFLMVLNDVYIPIRSQMLAMKRMPSLNEIYRMVNKDASHRWSILNT